MRSNVGLRFAAEAGAIVVAAVVAGPLLHLVWWQVGVVVFAVLGIAILLESRLGAAPARRPAPGATPQAPPAPEPAPHVRVLHEKPLADLLREHGSSPEPVEPAPEPAPEPEPEPEPERAPEPVTVAVAAPPERVAGPPFNIWELERAHAAGGGDDEKTFLLHYLRDYASSDGTLPSDFDDLVRESFGHLL